MDIKIYGTDTSGHKYVLSVIKELLLKAKIPFTLTDVTDISSFLEKGIESIPAIQMDNRPIIGLKSNGSFSTSLRKAIHEILSTQNYGNMTQYIIPTDFSDTSLNALSYGHRLATDLEAITKVLHVYKPKVKLDTQHHIEVATQQEVSLQLAQLVDSLNKDLGGDILDASLVTSELKVGFAVESIMESIQENEAKLVIIGSTGSSNLLKKVFGSVSLDVISKSKVPILLVPQSARYTRIRKVLFATDHTTIDTEEINSLLELSSSLDTELHIVHVSAKANTKLDINAVKEKYPKLSIKTAIVQGKDIPATINEYAVDNGVDIVALSPHTKSIFTHIINGSVTSDLALTSNIPLYIVK